MGKHQRKTHFLCEGRGNRVPLAQRAISLGQARFLHPDGAGEGLRGDRRAMRHRHSCVCVCQQFVAVVVSIAQDYTPTVYV